MQTIESLFTPPTTGGMSLMAVSAPVAPTGGPNYGASVANQVVIATVAGSQYWLLAGQNEIGTTFNNGTQSQAFTSAGQSFLFTAQGGVNFAGGTNGNPFTGSVQPASIQGTVPASTTRSTSSQRIRIFSLPVTTLTMKIIGKMQYVPMTFPYHEPLIKASSQTTMAFALAAMLKRSRQYTKADLEEKKAAALLLECAKLHSVQRTNNQRFIPEQGMGQDYFGPSQMGMWGFIS